MSLSFRSFCWSAVEPPFYINISYFLRLAAPQDGDVRTPLPLNLANPFLTFSFLGRENAQLTFFYLFLFALLYYKKTATKAQSYIDRERTHLCARLLGSHVRQEKSVLIKRRRLHCVSLFMSISEGSFR